MGPVTAGPDEHFRATVASWLPAPGHAEPYYGMLLELFEAQALSRHLDLEARRLFAAGEGFYTIGSAGHESNAAVAMALRPTDPALLHYRSGGFYCARAAQVPGVDPVRDVLLGLTASRHEPISGGRHKVFGNPALHVIPQTSTIASHLPRAVGLAFALHRAKRLGVATPWPEDAVVVTSLGDASINHSTAVGALNAAGHAVHTRLPLPLLVVCEDNGWGISVPSAAGLGGGGAVVATRLHLRSPPTAPTRWRRWRRPRRRSSRSGRRAGRPSCTCAPCGSSGMPAPTPSWATGARATSRPTWLATRCWAPRRPWWRQACRRARCSIATTRLATGWRGRRPTCCPPSTSRRRRR